MKKSIRIITIFMMLNCVAIKGADTSLDRVTTAINSFLHNTISPEERKALNVIESPRKTLSKDKTPLGSHTVAHSAGRSSVPFMWGKLLFHLTKAWQPHVALELGSCIGISGAYINAGLEANDKGQLISLERCDLLVPFIQKNWQLLGATRAQTIGGNVEQSLASLLPNIASIDVVFDDENHHEKPTLEKFAQIVPYVSSPALYVFDDIAWNKGMVRAWNAIKKSDKVAVSIALGNPGLRFGICIIDSTIPEKQDIIINLKKAKKVEVRNNKLIVQ